ncbi:unnamed protein product [Vitrella brassicaformis CCMP3155]|uniref:DUF6570 domain-containing protein n=1 Tax=Vitrella brassicaformis (strain CCMP3155) TaxID=1169540 RepID=A0A0G4EHW4_VITBC|nr:unnamed protein product [Vitrella brassicaformis CCMP3155]|eukprot:CEL95805.1 unnamed protein product [Vitrella brassicaformis CCMP3155]
MQTERSVSLPVDGARKRRKSATRLASNAAAHERRRQQIGQPAISEEGRRGWKTRRENAQRAGVTEDELRARRSAAAKAVWETRRNNAQHVTLTEAEQREQRIHHSAAAKAGWETRRSDAQERGFTREELRERQSRAAKKGWEKQQETATEARKRECQEGVIKRLAQMKENNRVRQEFIDRFPWGSFLCVNQYAEVTAHYRHVKHPCVVCSRAFRCTFSEGGKCLGESDLRRCIDEAEQQWQRYKRLRLEDTMAAQREKERRDRAQFILDTLNEISSDKVRRIDLQALANFTHLLQFRDEDRPDPANPRDALCVRALSYSEWYPDHPVMAKFDGAPLQVAAIRWEDKTVTICIECMCHLTRPRVKTCPRLSLANGLWRGPMDCKKVKIVSERTEGELLLVSKAIPFHCIYKLYPAGDGSGVVSDADRQLAVFGTVFVVPQDVDRLHYEIQAILPRDVDQMSRYIRIVYICQNEKADFKFIKKHARQMLGVDGSKITLLMEFLQRNCYRYAEDEVWVDPKCVIKLPEPRVSSGDAASYAEVPRLWLEFAEESDLFEENLEQDDTIDRRHRDMYGVSMDDRKEVCVTTSAMIFKKGDDLPVSERARHAMQHFTRFGGRQEWEEDGDRCSMDDALSTVSVSRAAASLRNGTA